MSQKETKIYKLNEEEKKIFKLELGKDIIAQYLLQIKYNFNQTYQIIMNIFKKLFNTKKNNIILSKELLNHIEELKRCEQIVLKYYKIMMIYLKIANSDINNTEICIEFENEQEKNRVLEELANRKKLLEEFKNNYNNLEKLKIEVNKICDKMIAISDMDKID